MHVVCPDGHDYLRVDKDGQDMTCGYGMYSEIGHSANPTDALIDLLIWVRKEQGKCVFLEANGFCKKAGTYCEADPKHCVLVPPKTRKVTP